MVSGHENSAERISPRYNRHANMGFMKHNVIGTDTELSGHPDNCDCPECKAWREFQPMYKDYTEARSLRLWEIYIKGFALNEPDARTEFYAEVPMNRHARRRLESKARKLRNS